MPAISKAQYLLMQAVKHGAIKKKGLSKEKAAEYVDNTSYKSLPKKIVKKMSKKD